MMGGDTRGVSMSSTVPPNRLLTAEEYARLPDDGRQTELVRGVIVDVSGSSDTRPAPENSTREVVFVRREGKESWARTLAAVVKHLSAGARAVCVLNASNKSVIVYREESEAV